jgi:hypothetical protein
VCIIHGVEHRDAAVSTWSAADEGDPQTPCRTPPAELAAWVHRGRKMDLRNAFLRVPPSPC